MKNFLLTAVLAASAVMPVMAGTALPYSETFDTAADFATMTVVDANSDNKTWYHSDYYKSAMIDYSDDSSMDDWLILPAFSLAPGGTYTFEMDARCYSSIFGTERFEVKMGTAATAAAMTETVVGETLLKTDKFQHFTQKSLLPQPEHTISASTASLTQNAAACWLTTLLCRPAWQRKAQQR